MTPLTTQDPRFQKALDLVARWAAKHPELRARLERAAFLIENVQRTPDPDLYVVGSATSGREYLVKINRWARSSTCTCPDSRKGHHCKHRLVVALYEKVTTGARPS